MASSSAAGTPDPVRERDLFLAALDFESAADRAAFLDRECRNAPELRASVEQLLGLHCDDSFLEGPAVVRTPESTPPATPAATPSPERLAGSLAPGDVVERYKLLQQIGEGGAGTVFMADQERPVRRRVALKVVRAGMDTKSVIARFETERQALAMMDHPNIAKVFDAGATVTGRPYFVMELVRGTRITSFCDESKLPTRERLRLFIQVCQAIQHAHQKGIIHRDIKPSNILVTLHDGVPIPKVIDFGIAKAIDHRLTDKTVFTEFQAFIGTPAYMSPEQAEMSGLDVDTRTDVYSLGVLLYEMLTGRTPFDAQQLLSSGLDGMRRTIREEEPLAPSTRLRTLVASERTTTATRQRTEPARLATLLHGDLDWIVLKALEKDRRRRYETATDLAHDVERYLNLEPISARPPSALYRFQKLVRRNRLAVVAATAFAVALLIGLGLASWQYLEKSAALRRAQEAELMERGLRESAQRSQAREIRLRRQAEEQEDQARRRAYAADINLAQEALAANNLGRARELLDHHRPSRNTPDLRGWEWRRLWLQCRSDALFTLKQESNEVATLSVSADGRWLAAATYGGSISITDLRTRQEIARIEARGWEKAAFSPTQPWLAFASSQFGSPPPSDSADSPRTPGPPRAPRHLVRFWDVAERRYLHEIRLSAPAASIAFAGDGARLAIATVDGQLAICDSITGSILRSAALPGLQRMARVVAFTRDLRLVAYPAGDGLVSVVDIPANRVIWSAPAAEEHVTALAFSPDGRWLATGGGFVESAVKLFDSRNGTEAARLEGHRTWVTSLVFWPDGHSLASASADQTIRLWRLGPGLPERDGTAGLPLPTAGVTLRGHNLEVWSLALAPDGTTLVSGSKDGSILVWDTTALRRDRSHLTLPDKLNAWAFAADSRSILSLDASGAVKRWQGEDFQDGILETQAEPPGFLRAEFSASARFLLVRRLDSRSSLWDLEHHAPVAPWHQLDPRSVVGFSPGSDTLLVRDYREGRLSEWDPITGSARRSWNLPASGIRPGGVVISPDGLWCLTLDHPGRATLSHLADGQSYPLEFSHTQIGPVVFSPDNRRFAWVSMLGTGELWELGPPRRTAVISGFLQGLASLAFSPDSRRAAIGSDGREAIKLWDAETGHELLTLGADGSNFRSTAFSPDGNLLGSANSAGRLHIWRAPSLEEIEAAEAPSP